MAASKEGLIDNINCKLTTGGLTDIQASQLAGAAQALCCSSFYAVPCCACLPSATANKGRFVYIQDIGRYRYSNGTAWTNEFCSASKNTLYTWGYNNAGRLGDDTTTNRSSPGTVAGGGTTWSRISAGNAHMAAIKNDGTLWVWGSNNLGRLGDGSTTNRSSPVTVAGGGTTWCAVAAGWLHTAAIKTDGTLWTWGYSASGQLGSGTAGFGACRSSPGTTAGGGTTWCAVSAGQCETAAVKTDGSLWTWGLNTSGQLGDGTATNRSSPGTVAGGGTTWCAVRVGNTFMMALKTDGSLWTWGGNSAGSLGTGNTTARSSPGAVAGGGTNWSSIAAGCYFAAATKTDGTLWTWGSNSNGELGTGNTTSRSSPGTTAGGGTTWSSVASSSSTARNIAAIKTDGTFWTWGCNNNGQLGDGSTTNRSSPGTVAGALQNWKQADVGEGSMIGLTFEGGF